MKYFLATFIILLYTFNVVFSREKHGNNDGNHFKPSLSTINVDISNTFIIHVKANGEKDRRAGKKEVQDLALKFKKKMEKENIALTITCHYYHYLRGFAVRLKDPEMIFKLEKLNLDYILSIQADKKVHLMNTPKITDFPLMAMKIPTLRNHVLLDTKDIKIGVIDQGIPFQDSAFVFPNRTCNIYNQEGCRVRRIVDLANAFVSGADLNSLYGIATDFQQHVMVYGDHGTMVASIMGGTDSEAPGVAQGALFYDYRTFMNQGLSPFSLCHLAANLAIEDDSDIIFMAFGIIGEWYDETHEIVLKKDGRNQIIFIAANGNQGLNGLLYQVSHSGQSSNMISVGSVQNPFNELCFFSFKTRNTALRESYITFSLQQTTFAEKCSPLVTFVTRKTAIIFDYGVKYFGDNLIVGTNQNLLTFIICDNLNDCFSQVSYFFATRMALSALIFVCECQLDVRSFLYLGCPIGHISHKVSEFKTIFASHYILFIDYYISHSLAEHRMLVPSAITSYGPNVFSSIKPDVSAIGSNLIVYAGSVNNIKKYVLANGTSLGAAFVAGISSAFIKQCQVHRIPVIFQKLLTRLQNTAQPFVYQNPLSSTTYFLLGKAHTVLQQGAGLVDSRAILHTKMEIIPSKLEIHFMDHHDETAHMKLVSCTISNHGSKEIHYSVTHIPASAPFYNPEKGRYELANLILDSEIFIEGAHYHLENEGQTLFSIKPNSAKKVDIAFVLNEPSHRIPFTFFNGYFKFTPISNQYENLDPFTNDEDFTLSLPYLLIYGNINEFPVLNRDGIKRAFLTDLTVMLSSKTYLEWNQLNQGHPPFPIYRDTIFPMPIFVLNGISKPVISMCFIFPIKKITFFLYDFFLGERPMGRISGFQSLPADCFLFYAKRLPLRYKDTQYNPTVGDLDLYQGWNGEYFVIQQGNLVMRNVTSGVYRICALIEKRLKSIYQIRRTHQKWCSSPFAIDSDQRT